MGRKNNPDLCVNVPALFICPISLEVMKSPVSLSTGVTYDRSSIQKWLDDGNNTCPATMQVLQTREFIPNHTLQRLIRIWSNTDVDSEAKRSPPSAAEVQGLITKPLLRRAETLETLTSFAMAADENKQILLSSGVVESLLEVLKETESPQRALNLLRILPHTDQTRRTLARPQTLAATVEILQRQHSNPEAAAEAAKLLEIVAVNGEMKVRIAASENLLQSLVSLCNNDETDAAEAALQCLLTLTGPRRNRLKLIAAGVIDALARVLQTGSKNGAVTALAILEMLCGCNDGRATVAAHSACIRGVVQRMLRVSDAATQHSLCILWHLCCFATEEKVKNVVIECNGFARLLLLLQSDCAPAMRRMAADLMKLLRQGAGAMSRDQLMALRYESKTTHISPF